MRLGNLHVSANGAVNAVCRRIAASKSHIHNLLCLDAILSAVRPSFAFEFEFRKCSIWYKCRHSENAIVVNRLVFKQREIRSEFTAHV